MQVVRSISKIRKLLSPYRRKGKTIGFVPTMGYFHRGHLSLMRKARKECDVVVVSLFVNPIQFGQGEDLDRYPRDFRRDKLLAEKEGVDFLFAPDAKGMYSAEFSTFVEVKGLDEVLCGARRPGHFKGVATVVAKLFNIVMPDIAYFGQKDIQQAIILKRMIRDLNFPVKMRIMPIVREKNGLAMSSRNVYLTPNQRREAVVLFQSLMQGKRLLLAGKRPAYVKSVVKKMISRTSGRIDYVEIVSLNDLRPVKRPKGKMILALAVWFGKARLIDNVIINMKGKR